MLDGSSNSFEVHCLIVFFYVNIVSLITDEWSIIDIAAQPNWSEMAAAPEEEEESNDDNQMSSYFDPGFAAPSPSRRLLPDALLPPLLRSAAQFDDAKSVPEDDDNDTNDNDDEDGDGEVRIAARIQRSLDSLQQLADSLDGNDELEENMNNDDDEDDIKRMIGDYLMSAQQQQDDDYIKNNNNMLLTMRRRQRRNNDNWSNTNSVEDDNDAEVDNSNDEKEEDNNNSMYDFDYNDSAAAVEGDGDDAVYYSTSGGDGISSSSIPAESVFDRRERLDVKKPGPFFTNSQNNFFLDKVIFPQNIREDFRLSDD